MSKKLPIEFKTKWLEALRGEEYKQGQGELERIDNNGNRTYCCLGVACKITHPDLILTTKHVINKWSFEKLDDIEIPKLLKGDEVENEIVNRLINMNDNVGKSFKEISDWIEENL